MSLHLLRPILTAVINGDANPKGFAAVDLSLLQLLQRESLASALLGIVTDGLAVHDRSHQARHRAREHALSLGKAVLPPPVLASSLIEPSPDTPLVRSLVMPVLVEVRIRDLDAEVGHCLPEVKTKHQIKCKTQTLTTSSCLTALPMVVKDLTLRQG